MKKSWQKTFWEKTPREQVTHLDIWHGYLEHARQMIEMTLEIYDRTHASMAVNLEPLRNEYQPLVNASREVIVALQKLQHEYKEYKNYYHRLYIEVSDKLNNEESNE